MCGRHSRWHAHLKGCILPQARESRMYSACFRHTSDTAEHSELSSTVILRCNVIYSVDTFRMGRYTRTCYLRSCKLYLNHDRCARSGRWRSVLIEFVFFFFPSYTHETREKGRSIRARRTERRFDREKIKRKRTEKGILPHR